MQDDLIRKIAGLMAEQSAAYTSLQSLTSQLIAALTRCDPASIETLSRSGEKELFRMRARLLEITTALTEFGRIRETFEDLPRLDTSAREKFEAEANTLLDAARSFEKVAGRATALSLGGSSFAAAAIQMCGIQPTTYNAPVLKYTKGATA